jgi:hypothetical protein
LILVSYISKQKQELTSAEELFNEVNERLKRQFREKRL